MPKVSIIIPVYNAEKYLQKCLDSVCNQTLSNIEIICINDCSTDSSLNILKEYASKDTRIQIINFEENKGVSIARNTGINKSVSKYIGFVDSDDFVDLDFYEKLYNKAIKTDADCVKGNIYDFDKNTSESILTDFYNQNDKIKQNKAYFCYGFTSAIYKTTILRKNDVKFPENITYFEDPYFSIFASIFINKIEIINNAKYHYIRHNDSACSAYASEKNTKDFLKAITLIYQKLKQCTLSEEDYCIYISFLLEHLINYCYEINIPEIGNKLAINTLVSLLNCNKVSIEKILTKYFLDKKHSEEKKMLNLNRTLMMNRLKEKIGKKKDV